ncbi:hypothetical protein NQ317_009166 [Molorchus minor]|uniref:C2H2-type domain-containing protein n=1 Tax=Molorchus minor TaxID=1323400 RepID=A0ABQ9K0D0_9CUCU|nr:hypothetical protein NQ317_009166 [Molorchus minor]
MEPCESCVMHLTIYNDFATTCRDKGIPYTINTQEQNALDNSECIFKRPDIKEVPGSNKKRERKKLKIFKCNVCELEMRSKSSLQRHSLIHRNISELEMYKCGTCQYQTTQKRYLEQHSMVHKNISEQQKYKCKMCDFRTKYKGRLKNKTTLKKHLLVHEDTSEQQMYECTICGFRSKHKGPFTVHLSAHEKSKNIHVKRDAKCVNLMTEQYNFTNSDGSSF